MATIKVNFAPTPDPIEPMQTRILTRLASVPGRVGFYYHNLATAETIAHAADERYLAASVIKLPICAAVARMADDGRADLDEHIPVRECDIVPGCGTLQHMAAEVDVLSVRTLCRLMITVSDNMATNLLINRFGISTLNAEFAAMGLTGTRLERKMFDAAASAAGLQNRIVPREMGGLLAAIHAHTLGSETASRFVEQTLLAQQINHKIPGYLKGVRIAHKTGEDTGITNDVGIVYTAHPFVLAFACNETDVPEAERAMREISLWLGEANQ